MSTVWVLLVSVALVGLSWLTARDPREDVRWAAAAWPVSAVGAMLSLGYLGAPIEAWAKLGLAVYVGVVVGTWFRPGLIVGLPRRDVNGGWNALEVLRFFTGWAGVLLVGLLVGYPHVSPYIDG